MTTPPALRFLRPREVPVALAALDALVAHEDGALPDPRACGALEEVDLMLSRLPPDDAGRCRALLKLVEWGPVFRGYWRRFTRLGLAGRRAFLDGLAVSRIAALREAYTALKSLVMLSYYTRPATWPAIGYDGPWLGRVAVEVAPVPRKDAAP